MDDTTLLLKPPRTQDPLDGTTGELRRLTRHLLTLVVRYRGRVSLPRGRAPGERRWQVGIPGDLHTIAHLLTVREGFGPVTITDGLGYVRRYDVLLSRQGFDRLMAGVCRAWRLTAGGTWQPTETATTALEAAPPGDGWRLAYITLVPGSYRLYTYTWSRVRVALPPDPRKSEFLRRFNDAINGIQGTTVRAAAQRELEHLTMRDVDYAKTAARAGY